MRKTATHQAEEAARVQTHVAKQQPKKMETGCANGAEDASSVACVDVVLCLLNARATDTLMKACAL
eukprot:8392284-Prorocentrum_lima.AAC.1